jgi:TBC1 domain family protein 5
MWDALFAIDSSLELVDMISIAMLLRIRWQLVEADTNEVFTLLLRYPEPDSPAYTFIKDALYLRDHLTPEGGSEIIRRYGKKAPPIDTTKVPVIRDPSPSPSFASSRTRRSMKSPTNFMSQQSGGLEALLQNAAKGVLDRGSQWNVGKAIRDAVGEVKKNVEAYQTGAITTTASGETTPRSGGREFRKPTRIATDTGGKPTLQRTQSGNIIKKIEGMERRNQSLSKMLESAVGELWDHHKERSENAKENKDALDALSLAIAKVQFVQVYLEDSSIPLPSDEPAESEAATTPKLLSPSVPERTSSAPPASSGSVSRPMSSSANVAEKSSLLSPNRPTSPPDQQQPTAGSSSLAPRARPLLSSSSFSWMLGQESDAPRSTFAKASEHSAFPSDEKRRMRGSLGKGYLFGDDEGNLSPVESKAKRGSVSSKGGKKPKEEQEVEEEVIDLGDMGKRGAVS